MAQRSMDVKIETDGKISLNTGDMSGEHHMSAQEFLDGVAFLLGQTWESKSTKTHHHHHHHGGQDVHHDHK